MRHVSYWREFQLRVAFSRCKGIEGGGGEAEGQEGGRRRRKEEIKKRRIEAKEG